VYCRRSRGVAFRAEMSLMFSSRHSLAAVGLRLVRVPFEVHVTMYVRPYTGGKRGSQATRLGKTLFQICASCAMSANMSGNRVRVTKCRCVKV
jgi:hypothetical protein